MDLYPSGGYRSGRTSDGCADEQWGRRKRRGGVIAFIRGVKPLVRESHFANAKKRRAPSVGQLFAVFFSFYSTDRMADPQQDNRRATALLRF